MIKFLVPGKEKVKCSEYVFMYYFLSCPDTISHRIAYPVWQQGPLYTADNHEED